MLAFEVVHYAAISHKPELQIPSSCLAIIEETINLKNMFTNFTGECQSNSSWPVALEGFADATVTQCTQVNQQLNR